MPITREYVHEIFEHAKNNEQAEMFRYVRDDVRSMAVNPEIKSSFASGGYTNKLDYQKALSPFGSMFTSPLDISINRILVDGNTAVVELRSEAPGKRTEERYVNYVCMILEFDDHEEPKVKKFHEYLDSAHLQAFYEKNKD
ncbi:hypothetical protein I203_106749 [Kwoniella mangroviensis CBS 8507]|uniref:uncharacterized protein n=1 Tax=Kwoniella mangroviensis CBS 8507 TaxID=1296122 RepID=UPI00080D7E0F|nr:uncharacterized protein I203_07836 [Kwoniella mangroviensis CBS 8507]OCF63100.1 hypothetical protein I203_07836 [Kwoniella mangroviensis CBS 8507]